MKNRFLLSIVLSLIIGYTLQKAIIPTSNWVLDVKNEKGEKDIVLKPNVLTKVIFVVRHEDNLDILDRSFDKANFIITLDDDSNIKLFNKEIKNGDVDIIPSLTLESYAYIGLKSDHEIEAETYDLQFKVKNTKDLDGHDYKDASLKIDPVQVTINNTESLIEIEPIETSLTEKGYSLFRIKNEIYNMEKVVITLKEEIGDYFTFKDVEINALKDREEFGLNENDNHGIIFDFPFGTEKEYKDLQEFSKTIKLMMKEDDLDSKWFKLSDESQSFNLTINQNELVKLNDSVKEAIVYTIENVTPKRDLTNNIQINMTIPVAPVLIECRLDGEGNNEEGDSIKYRDYILQSGPYLLKFDDLNSNNEYKGECKFYSVNFDKTEIKITIGNDKDYDFVTPLYPSRTNSSIPQCLEFTFTSQDEEKLRDKVKKFTDLAEKLCHKTMTEDENIISRIMGNFKCEKAEFSEEVEKNKNDRSIICIGASPSFKSKKFRESLINLDNTYFENHVNIFVESVNSTENIQKAFKDEEDLEGLELVEFKRYYDLNEPDVNKIKLVVDTQGGMKKKENLKFNITSTNDQPIECFYNNEMNKNDKKRFIELYQNRGNGKGITLYPNEEKTFETKLNNVKDKQMFTLYMNCYNLPGAKIRYEQTGVFNAYTYLYTESEEEQNVIIGENVTINCAEKNNRINPHCLKGQYNALLNKIKTKMPEIDTDEEVEKFNKLSNSSQVELLNDLVDKFNKDLLSLINKPIQLIERVINLAKYLTSRDCSKYSDGSTNDLSKTINNELYKSCRDGKKKIIKRLNDLITTKIQCDTLVSYLKGLTNNIEENVKYIILLIQELGNSPDAFNEGEGEILYNITTCFQEKFDDIWTEVENYLKQKGSLDISISAVKKDLSNILIQSLSNLIKILHFEEIDNYISESDRNITKTGIMGNKNGKKIHKSIKEFMKHFNEFGNGEYNLTDSIMINVTINDEYKEEGLRNLEEDENEEQVINYEDKGIVVILHPKYMMKKKNAYAMQVVRYDSPIMPIKTSGHNNDSTLDTFVSITLYDNKGNEVNIDDLPENIRPKILYNKSYHKFLKHCFFYNENTEDLDETGVTSEDDVEYKGNKYFKCTTKHLTSFTAGNYYSTAEENNENNESKDKGGLSGLVIFLIILGVIVLLILLIFIIICIKKRNAKNSIEEISKNDGTMALMN